jgi:hypothetical protein
MIKPMGKVFMTGDSMSAEYNRAIDAYQENGISGRKFKLNGTIN